MLQLMALGIPDVMNFDFMSKPSPGKMPPIMNHCTPLVTQEGREVIVNCFVYPRGRSLCCGAFRAAGSCGEEGGPGFPNCSGKEDGQLPSGAKICQGEERFTHTDDVFRRLAQMFLYMCIYMMESDILQPAAPQRSHAYNPERTWFQHLLPYVLHLTDNPVVPGLLLL